jgi:hypothetical protein
LALSNLPASTSDFEVI